MWLFHDLLCTPFHCLLKHETLAKLKCYFVELTFYTCGKYHLFSTLLFPRNCWDFFRLSALHKSPSLSHARSSLWRKMYPHNFVQLTIRNLLLSFFSLFLSGLLSWLSRNAAASSAIKEGAQSLQGAQNSKMSHSQSQEKGIIFFSCRNAKDSNSQVKAYLWSWIAWLYFSVTELIPSKPKRVPLVVPKKCTSSRYVRTKIVAQNHIAKNIFHFCLRLLCQEHIHRFDVTSAFLCINLVNVPRFISVWLVVLTNLQITSKLLYLRYVQTSIRRELVCPTGLALFSSRSMSYSRI